ncbi:hypothetical protein QE152_g939 [Popillia japonica]|uniref:Uncharacterized protein n=1 Tax=Popillia japonica TaxID=7064 RepID=A0AAW1NAQ9_POPJA
MGLPWRIPHSVRVPTSTKELVTRHCFLSYNRDGAPLAYTSFRPSSDIYEGINPTEVMNPETTVTGWNDVCYEGINPTEVMNPETTVTGWNDVCYRRYNLRKRLGMVCEKYRTCNLFVAMYVPTSCTFGW